MEQPAAKATWRRKAAVIALLVLVVFVVATVRLFVLPELAPLPARADAIIELAGPGNRDAATMALVREGRAPVVAQSTVPVEAGGHTCLPQTPGVEVLCFNPNPGTTLGEARYIGEVAAQRHWQSVIIVTTPDHALRAELRVSRCFPGTIYVATSPLPWWDWFKQIPYQWAASVKALVFQTGC
jgi:uncharacterized SAM-binding protein YcdF (DUF218 family)